MRTALLTLLALALSPAAMAQDWGPMAVVSSTMGVQPARICIGEGTRSDIGCPTYAPSVSPTGTLNVTGGIATDNVSLTTSGVTWGYLASSISYLPALNAGSVSTTNISVSTINGVAASSLGSSGMPTGAVVGFNLASCPSGWSEYTPARGRFLRGIDSTGTIDPSGTRVAGNVQADTNKNHSHTGVTDSAGSHTHTYGDATNANVAVFQTQGGTGMDGAYLVTRTTNAAGAHTHTLTINADGAAEARPKNVAVLYCQKD